MGKWNQMVHTLRLQLEATSECLVALLTKTINNPPSIPVGGNTSNTCVGQIVESAKNPQGAGILVFVNYLLHSSDIKICFLGHSYL